MNNISKFEDSLSKLDLQSTLLLISILSEKALFLSKPMPKSSIHMPTEAIQKPSLIC